MLKSKTQPYCKWCGKPLRKHARSVWIEPTSSSLTEAGARTDEYSRYIFRDDPPKSIDECRPLTNWTVISTVRHYDNETIRRFGEWDGESWQSRGLFCSTTCAQAMGQSAAKYNNLVGPGYRDRMRELSKEQT